MSSKSPAEVIAGRYRIDAKLGEGGMGVVYKVWDQVGDRALALKCLTPTAVGQPLALGLFEREFHTLKNLPHPHIVEVYDYGIAETPYYTMEFLEGATVSHLSPMAWQEASSLLRDVASALALIHSRRLVHRDVTGRNIQCAEDGTVKLIDFGGLAPMGVAKDRVGTPAFVAPEVLHQLALDQRTDLYSLGATAYHLLTGQHAFPARHASELRDMWRTRPPKPSSIVNDVPAALDELVMSMLDLDPLARPVNAGIVIARLSAIAGLPPQASEEDARSFLSAPRLIGRERELAAFQARIARAMRGAGSCLLIEAPAGMGRSRILDAFALEAQIAGAIVLRADSRDGATDAKTLAALRAGLHDGASDEPPSLDNQEAITLETLRAAMRTCCVAILVDDAHRYGAASLALLTRLVRLTERHRLVLVVSIGLPPPEEGLEAIRVLRGSAERTELVALDPGQTSDLLASCFDDVPNLKVTAAWCHTVSAGRPGACVELAQHLVDEGIAAYRDGVWALPESLLDHSLPETAEQLLRERVRRLDEDQLLCGQLLSLIPFAVSINMAECVDIMRPLSSRARAHAAIEGLMAEQLVISEVAALRVGQSQVRDAFLATLPESRACSLHRALATFLESRGDEASLTAAAHHLQQAGDHELAVRLVHRYAKRITSRVSEEELARLAVPFGEWGGTFETALEFAEREGWPRHEVYPLYSAIVTVAALTEPRWLSRGKPLFDYLKQDTGLVYWSEAELDVLHAGGKVSQWKLVWRLLRATLRHRFARRHSRGLRPRAALTVLGVYVTSALGACNITQEFHTGLPPLARALLPFRSLSPAIDLLYDLLVGAIDAARGLEAGWKRLESVLQRLQQRVKGMPEAYRSTAHYVLRYLDAMERLAPKGDPASLEVAEWLEGAGGFHTHAWQLRMLYHLYVGDSVGARRCQQELETLALTSARNNLSVIAGSKDVAQAQALSGDALALRATLESLEATADRFPNWRGQLLVYRGEYARLVGDLPQAEEALEQALAFAEVGENYSWAKAVGPYVDILARLGQVKKAVAFADHAVEKAARLGVSSVYRRQIEMAAALAWAADGQHDRAAHRLEQLLDEAKLEGVRGVTAAVLEEARAQVALACGDADVFERACLGAAQVFANHDNPALVARYRRLVDEAYERGLAKRVSIRPSGQSCQLPQSASEIGECIEHTSAAVRLRRALELLMKHCDAEGGHLFGVNESRVACVASAGEMVSALELESFVESVRTTEAALDIGVTATDVGLDDDVSPANRWMSNAGVTYESLPLYATGEDDDDTAVGIAVLCPRDEKLRRPPADVLRALARILKDRGDLPGAVAQGWSAEALREGPASRGT
jgi:tetratricopeptide (TPR) repeat protein